MEIRPGSVDEELAVRTMRLSYSDVNIETPYKACSHRAPIAEVNEVFTRYSKKKLTNMLGSTIEERRANTDLKSRRNGGINVLVPEYTDAAVPNEEMVRALAQVQHAHADVVVTPVWSNLIGELVGQGDRLMTTLVNLNGSYIESIEALNNKTIWGVVPQRLPRLYLREYVQRLVEQEVTSFVVDFNNAAVDSNPSWLSELLMAVKEYRLLEESVFYALNANEGRFSKRAEVIPAKDFLCCGFDFDLLGMNNTMVRGNKEFFEKLKNNRGIDAAITYRDFDRDNYGYRRRETGSGEVREQAKRMNLRRQVEESAILRQHLAEDRSVKGYILTKQSVTEKMISSSKALRAEIYGRERARQTTLI